MTSRVVSLLLLVAVAAGALSNGRMALSARCGYCGTTEVTEFDAGRSPKALDQFTCGRLGRMNADAATPLYLDAGGQRVRADQLALGQPCTVNQPDVSWPLPAGENLYFFASIRGAALSRGGETLIVAAKRDAGRAVWRVDLSRAKVSRLAEGDYGAVPLAPDGRRVAAVLPGGAGDDAIRLLNL